MVATLQMIWFPVLAMIVVVALVIWARGASRPRRTAVVKGPVVIEPVGDSRDDDDRIS